MNLTYFVPNQNENSRAFAYRLLRNNIMTLKLVPGTVIKEGELSRQLNMSRTPIHEAITALKDEWLVEVVPQSGTKVTLIDKSLLKEGYNARLLFESSLLSDCAGKLGRTQASALQDCLSRQEAASEKLATQPDIFIQLDDEMHRMMYAFSGRARTWQAIRGLVSHYDRARYLDAMSGKTDTEKVLREHREFYNYMLMGMSDGTDAMQKMREHLTSFRGDYWDNLGEYSQYFTL
ncbi:MAG: GntR family transcriptional regulator [Oscillospiraceae bacterium]